MMRNEVGVADAVLLEPVETGTFVRNLATRLYGGLMYTYIGEVLVSVNPYKPLYGGSDGEADLVKEYRGRGMYERPPHIFAVAEAALHSIRHSAKDAAILITGESGAGKTEASKAIMRYLAAVTNTPHQPRIQRVKEIILRSNCVLEAFGNAKTSRNDNSSRFGKYMAVEFNFRGEPVGGAMRHFLLEKSRLIRQGEGERNFHSFYQLLSMSGVTAPLSSKDPRDYRYLCGGGGVGKKEAAEGRAVVAGMDWLGLASDEIWRCLAGILELGNVDMEAVNGNEESSATEAGRVAAAASSSLLGLKALDLEKALSSRLVPSPRAAELLRRPLTKAQAEAARDALAKALYQRLFAHIVNFINAALREGTEKGEKASVIGVLDIYGFEIFGKNSFEQLCINYANEQLQQQFIQLVLKTEQEEYAREGIQWTPVEYYDNGPICQLIQQPHSGIFAVLDEACATVGTLSDKDFLQALDRGHHSSPHYASRGTASSDKSLAFQRDFRLNHYAGPVIYSVDEFIEKNRDDLFLHLSRLCYGSSSPFVSALFPEGSASEATISKRPPTAATRFNASIKALLEELGTKTPHYVRCIKPNALKAPGQWDESLVRHQVAYLGLLENVRVRRAGFAYRSLYTSFLHRYKLLCQATWPNWSGSPEEGVRRLLDHLQLSQDVAYGRSKVFIRSPKTLFRLEELREAAIPPLVLLLQSHWRGFLGRRRATRTKAVYRIADAFRRYKLRSHLRQLLELFSGVEKMGDLGRSLSWPHPPAVLADFQNKLRGVHRSWRCRLVRERIPREEWATFSLKLGALELLRGRRSGEWGWGESWKGDYVGASSFAPLPPHQRLLFASSILKFNKHEKSAERILLVTDQWIGKAKAKTGKMMEHWPLADLQRVGLSSEEGPLVVLGFGNGYEIVLALTSPGASVGELVGRLWPASSHPLTLDIAPQLNVRLGSKTKTFSERTQPQMPLNSPSFQNAPQNSVFLLHTGPSSH